MAEQNDRRFDIVRSAIITRFTDALESIGQSDKAIKVRLKPSAISIAEVLKKEFGETIEITVGFKPFPFRKSHIPLPSIEAIHPQELFGLRITCELAITSLIAGESTTGCINIENIGTTPLELDGSANMGWLCKPDTLIVVGGHSGAIAPVKRAPISIEPKSKVKWNFIVGTASCESDDTYVVKKGYYEVVVPVYLEVRERNDSWKLVHSLARGCYMKVL